MKLFPSFERDLKLEERVLNDILHPEFSEKFPEKGFIRIIRFKFRRWLANRWKHRIRLPGRFDTYVFQAGIQPSVKA